MLNSQDQTTLDRYWKDFCNNHDLTLSGEIFADDFVLYDPLSPDPVQGRETFVEMVKQLWSAFPDAHYTEEERVCEGNKVWIRWTMRATHRGLFLGVAATHKQVVMSGVDMLTLASGRFETLRVEANLLGPANQLGAVPNLSIGC